MSVRALPFLFAFAGGCTLTSDEFQPSPVIAETEANRPAMPGAAGQSSAGAAPVGPVLAPGEVAAPINNLLPPDTTTDMSNQSSSGVRAGGGGMGALPDLPVLADAGDDAGGDAGRDAGDGAGTDAGANGGNAGRGDGGSGRGGVAAAADAGVGVAPPAGSDAAAPDASVPAPRAPCPGLVFEGSCYEFFSDQLSWETAQARCVAWGGHLASVESYEEDAFLGAWPALVGIGFLDGSGLWLGGTDAQHDGDFRWSDESALSFIGWASDQPNNGQGVDCIEKRNDASQRWYDRRCTDGERYVCERAE